MEQVVCTKKQYTMINRDNEERGNFKYEDIHNAFTILNNITHYLIKNIQEPASNEDAPKINDLTAKLLWLQDQLGCGGQEEITIDVDQVCSNEVKIDEKIKVKDLTKIFGSDKECGYGINVYIIDQNEDLIYAGRIYDLDKQLLDAEVESGSAWISKRGTLNFAILGKWNDFKCL